VDIRIPMARGIAGHVATTRETVNTPDAYTHPLFNRDIDTKTGYRTKSLLAMPIIDPQDRTVAVVQMLNKKGDRPFDANDEKQVAEFSKSMAVLLESWWHMKSQQASRQQVGTWEWRMLDRASIEAAQKAAQNKTGGSQSTPSGG
jgi:signal transduction protein with GAF and PtsI domain